MLLFINQTNKLLKCFGYKFLLFLLPSNLRPYFWFFFNLVENIAQIIKELAMGFQIKF